MKSNMQNQDIANCRHLGLDFELTNLKSEIAVLRTREELLKKLTKQQGKELSERSPGLQVHATAHIDNKQ